MKKVGLLILVLVIALGALGVGYAKWTDTVTIGGSVNTGSINLGILDTGTDDASTTADPQCGLGNNDENKNVASTTSTNGAPKVPPCLINSTQYFAGITETIVKAYPYYSPTFHFQIGNCGSVPVKIESPIGIDASGVDLTPWMALTWTILDEYGQSYDGTGGSFMQLFSALQGMQIGGGLHITVNATICFQETNIFAYTDNEGQHPIGTVIMPQNADTSFTITVTASQWNEV